ncbi:MAG: hypothetical protein KAX39_05925 [candidate division Zixibacteria bacterium]|nr:hypothetical protein [candidate division Zixibacteria bacterium]
MNTEYFLILPNVYLHESCSIGEATFHRFGSADGKLGNDKNEELLKNIQQMLFNNGFSGLFTYYYFDSNQPFQNIVLDVRKIMTIFRYVVFEEHPDYSLELLTYYLLQAEKLPDEVAEMKYWLEGIQDGNQHIHFEAPGFREVTRRVTYPEVLSLHDGHFLIQRFDANDLEDKYIIAMERFNRTRKENHDHAEDILNLATAFEHIFKLKGTNKAELLAMNLVQTFELSESPLAGTFAEWSKQFYKTRGELSHGNAFEHYRKETGYNFWEDCFKWKHPNGSTGYRPHAYIASKIFQLLIERLLGGQEAIRIKELEQMLTEYKIKPLIESKIESLITYNEIQYRKLKELVDSGKPFDHAYFDLVSKIKQRDGTEDKSVLLELLPHFLNVTENRFPDLQKECKEIMNLLATENMHSIGSKVMKLSQKIKGKETDRHVMNDETVKVFCLWQFFEKAYLALTHIAWLERSTK